MKNNVPGANKPDSGYYDLREEGYIGFMYFSQKSCGAEFINAIMDYSINFRILDFNNM